MDVGRRRADAGVLRTGNSVVAGSVWESRMKVDEVRGGIKVFNGDDQENNNNGCEESSGNSNANNGVAATTARTPTRLKKDPGVGLVSNGKRKTWNSGTSLESNCDKSPVRNIKSLKSCDEQSKEQSKNPVGISRLRSEVSKEGPVGIRKPRAELVKSASDLVKVKPVVDDGIQLRKVKSELKKEVGDLSVEVIEKNPDGEIEIGSDEKCKEFGVCKEMVIATNVDGVVKSAAIEELVNEEEVGDGIDEDESEVGDEIDDDELVDEEIEPIEVEKKSVDHIKEICAPPPPPPPPEPVKVHEKLSKVVVREVKVVNEVKKLQFDRKSRYQEVKKVHQMPEAISLNNVRRQSPVMRRAAVYSNVPKQTSYAASNDQHHSFPETHSRLQSLADLIMWKDTSRSVFIFGIGSFIILSSSYMRDVNISFISVMSYMGLVYLAAIFFLKSIISRGAVEIENANSVVGEEEAIWLMKLVLPYLNEFLLKLRALFSGDPATTIKLAVLLFVLARCGSSITIWTMSKVGFFGVFTVPKICSLYSTQITIYATFWVRRFRDVWDSCTHKKALSVGIFMLVWNLSSVGARIWAAFILLVALRYYQQKKAMEEWTEDDVYADAAVAKEEAEETLLGGQKSTEVDSGISKHKRGL